MGYEEELYKFLDDFCDLFFLTKEELKSVKPNSTIILYRHLFFYACRKKFPIVSYDNIGRILGKRKDTVYEGISTIYSLKGEKDIKTLKLLKALKRIL